MDQLERELRVGSGIAGCMREEPLLPRDVYTLLAQANLLRVRGQWEQAAQSCMAALRLAPDSASANSLLGDIYENQGRYEDAAQWYRMALDANPDSPADRLKLDRLAQRVQMPQDKTAEAGVAAAISEPLPSQSPLRRLVRDPETVLRYGAIAAALGLILVVACAYMVVHRAGGLRSRDAIVKSSPVVVPPLAGVIPNDSDQAPARDPSEQSVLAALQSSRDLSASGITVYDVQVDPRTDGMSVTFGFVSFPGLTQAQVARHALQVLQDAASAHLPPQSFTARCLLLSGIGTDASLVFVGDASRQAVQTAAADGGGLSDSQAVAVFANVWWSPTADIRA